VPFLKAFINRRIANDPSVLEAKLEDRFRELVLKPLAKRAWWRRILNTISPPEKRPNPKKQPNLVIIDGLDECSDEKTQLRILSMILSSYQQSPRPPLRFLICSRSESWIREAFETAPLRDITKSIVLDDAFLPDQDIERYYLHEFEEIRTSPRYSRLRFTPPGHWSRTSDGWSTAPAGNSFTQPLSLNS
jgi:hypothetical protein